MKNEAMAERLGDEIMSFVSGRRSLMLSSLTEEGLPYASYAPFALGKDCLYVQLSDIAVHAVNLKANQQASVLIIEDEDTAQELFARIRVSYRVRAEHLAHGSEEFNEALARLVARHGDRPASLSELSDFHMFQLWPEGGRYIKGFGQAYSLAEGSLANRSLTHLRDGHKPRSSS
ncbi:MAG: pyridoxamine 5'-phosphate oxidase family protein [Pseudomonadota bacterium]